MSTQSVKFFLITGDPDLFTSNGRERATPAGVGKTTMTKKITTFLQDMGLKTSGFYTEEVRSGRSRDGFDVVSLDGKRGRLARDQSLLDAPLECSVGKYGVLVEEFEKIGLPALINEDATSLLVIDEIGKMEFFSSQFKERIKQIFSDNSNHTILATIPVRKSDMLIERIRIHKYAKLWTVTRENRNTLHEEIIKEILETLLNKQTKIS